MAEKLITIENRKDPYWYMFQRILRMVPDRDRSDARLQRLLAFRLRRDGEAATHEYLIEKVRSLIQCRWQGSMYEFVKDDRAEIECGPPPEPPPQPPDVA
jgi:hypothetical protein